MTREKRIGIRELKSTRNAQRRLSQHWPDLVRVPVTEALVEHADALAWEHGPAVMTPSNSHRR
jgi:hypothetical protein